MSATGISSHLPPADPRYLHTVGWWQGVLDNLGRLAPLVAQLTPDSPITLCGKTLVIRDSTQQHVPSDAEVQALPACPACAESRTPQRDAEGGLS